MFRQNITRRPHIYQLGAVMAVNIVRRIAQGPMEVNMRGLCRLYVVARVWDCQGNPEYILSDLCVAYPATPNDDPPHMFKKYSVYSQSKIMYHFVAKIVEHVKEDHVRPTGEVRDLCPDLEHW